MEKLKHFSLFSGIESFKKALTNIGIDNELVGYSEFDKYASVALSAIHGVSEELNYGDITKIDETKLPDCDLITYGFPCQDISIAGLGKGIVEGETRSGLLYDALRIIKYKMPKYAIAENVKNLVGKKFKDDFNRLLEELDDYGYNNYWKVLNAKDYGIPQNRERVFIVSIRKDVDDGSFEFPEPYDSGLRLKDFLEDKVEEKYYINNDKTNRLLEDLKGKLPNQEVSYCLDANYAKGTSVEGFINKKRRQLVQEPVACAQRGRYNKDGTTEQQLEIQESRNSNTLTTVQKDNLVLEQTVCEQRTDEGLRFFKDDVCGTLRTIDSGGDKRVLEPNNLKLFTNLEGGKWDKIHESARRVYNEEGIAPTIPTCGGGNIEPKVQTQYRIRKLIPLECWRLMGFTDEDYHKARVALEDRFYNGRDRSNSQMYKMAGNSIVVNVLEGILKNLIN